MIKYIFIHCTDFSYKKNGDQFNQTNLYHKTLWPDFKSSLGYWNGYNYEISASGKVYKARQEGEETAAVIGYNKNSVHICLDGDFDIELPTDAQVRALTPLLIKLQLRYNVPLKNVVPHRFAAPHKTCYGSKLSDTWAQELIKNYKGNDLGKEC